MTEIKINPRSSKEKQILNNFKQLVKNRSVYINFVDKLQYKNLDFAQRKNVYRLFVANENCQQFLRMHFKSREELFSWMQGFNTAQYYMRYLL